MIFHRLTVYLNAPRWQTDSSDYDPFFGGSTLIFLEDSDKETERCSPPSSPPGKPWKRVSSRRSGPSLTDPQPPEMFWKHLRRAFKQQRVPVTWEEDVLFTALFLWTENDRPEMTSSVFKKPPRSPPTADRVCREAGERQGSDVIKQRLWPDGRWTRGPSGCSACRASVTFALCSVCAPPGPGRRSAGRLSTWMTSEDVNFDPLLWPQGSNFLYFLFSCPVSSFFSSVSSFSSSNCSKKRGSELMVWLLSAPSTAGSKKSKEILRINRGRTKAGKEKRRKW